MTSIGALAALAGCASTPLVYPDVVEPEAVAERVPAREQPIVALALGGGAARGFAHVGVIKELERSGIVPDIVVGTSVGSFVGALFAGGYTGDALQYIATGLDEADLRDITVPDRGFVRGERLQDFVNRYLDNRSIEKLPKRFAAVATDLKTGVAVVFTRGNTGKAVRASSSIPGVFQPVAIGGREYVDGGLASPVPVEAARALGADVVIAVDVSRRPEDAVRLDSATEIIVQAIAIMGKHVGLGERNSADVLIRPNVSEIGLVDFEHKSAAIEAGEAAARAALEGIRKAIAGARREKAQASPRAG